MTKYRFVHLSDIHFGQEKHGTKPTHEDVRSQLIRDAHTIKEQLGEADGILITGDIAYSGKPEEYQEAGTWIDSLIEAIGCDKRSVCLVPGNHDVDIEKITYITNLVYDKIRNSGAEKIDQILNQINSEDELTNPIFAKFSAYREFAARYDCDFSSFSKPFWVKEYNAHGDNVLRFIGLNTVQLSDLSDRVGGLILGSSQYIIPNEQNHECIVLMHHPLNWLKDGRDAERYLKRARVIMVGHEHDLRIRKVTEDDLERLEIYAGATNPEAGDGYQFRYNWIEFETVYNEGKYNLHVTIYPRVWDDVRTKFIADLNRLDGDQSKTLQLNCPHFVFSERKEVIDNNSSKKHVDEEVIDIMVDQKENPDNFENNFGKLRYYFWKYLDWQERLEVLVSLDILPATRVQPVPQTLEKLALEHAKEIGKLFDLWNEIMKFVPSEEQEENPFV